MPSLQSHPPAVPAESAPVRDPPQATGPGHGDDPVDEPVGEPVDALVYTLVDQAAAGLAFKDLQGRYRYANRQFAQCLLRPGQNCVGRADRDLIAPGLALRLAASQQQALRDGTTACVDCVLDAQAGDDSPADGVRRQLRVSHRLLRTRTGEPFGFIVQAEDTTALRRTEEQLRISERLVEQAGESIFVTDRDGNVQKVNSAFMSITGYTEQEAIGQSILALKAATEDISAHRKMWLALQQNDAWKGELWCRRKNGERYLELITINRVDDEIGGVAHYIAVCSDISLVKESQKKAEFLATHDTLTGLPNRARFQQHLRRALARARRSSTRVALLFIDLDHFKTINDTLGHEVGDRLLRDAGQRLRGIVQDGDLVARLGGDEFTAILTDSDEIRAAQVGQDIVRALSSVFAVGRRQLFVSASVGIAFFPTDGHKPAALTRAADAAMYRAKELGRNRVEMFKPDLQVRLIKRATLENALREAQRHERFRLVFQPKYELGEGRDLVGVEALLRWTDPTLGEVSPSEFVPAAEANGSIVEIDRSVQQILFAQMASWRAEGLGLPLVAFNVSPRSIREPDFARYLLDLAQRTGVPTDCLQIEITEGALLENSQHVLENLAALDEAGIRIAIDDFGTGYSSLGYLKRLPLDELKIDRSFIYGLGHDRGDEAIAKAVLGLAQALGLKTVAEGIETQRQLEWLERHRCSIGQGWLLSRPLSPERFLEVWRASRSARTPGSASSLAQLVKTSLRAMPDRVEPRLPDLDVSA